MQIGDVEDVDGAAVWGRGRAAAEERGLTFGVAGEGGDGCGKGGAGEEGGDDGAGGEMHGGDLKFGLRVDWAGWDFDEMVGSWLVGILSDGIVWDGRKNVGIWSFFIDI